MHSLHPVFGDLPYSRSITALASPFPMRPWVSAPVGQVIRFNLLPDDVLLEISGFYTENPSYKGKAEIEAWQSLVHVCRRWRSLVFGSPRHLNLALFCTPETPARDTLDVWPALPLLIAENMALSSVTDNVIAALGQNNRVREIVLLELTGWQLEKVLAPMQVSFPELTDLRLCSRPSHDETLIIPDSFLNGCAPRLRKINLDSISFPGLPILISSATRLVKLYLYDIPCSGYISPKTIVALLSVLSTLESLYLLFQSPQHREKPELIKLLIK